MSERKLIDYEKMAQAERDTETGHRQWDRVNEINDVDDEINWLIVWHKRRLLRDELDKNVFKPKDS